MDALASEPVDARAQHLLLPVRHHACLLVNRQLHYPGAKVAFAGLEVDHLVVLASLDDPLRSSIDMSDPSDEGDALDSCF